MTIEQLKKEQSELEDMLLQNRQQQNELIRSEFTKKYGIKIGDTVKFFSKCHRVGIVKFLCIENRYSVTSINIESDGTDYYMRCFEKIKVIQ